MRKKWKRYKNRIMALGMALSISCSSVFLPSMEVMASSEVEQLEIKGVWEDKNGDGQMNVNEVNPFKLVASSFSRLGVWCDTGKEAFSNAVDMFKSWLESGSDSILGYLSDDGLVHLNDDTWDFLHTVANALRGSDGLTIYPAMPSGVLYYYGLTGYSYSTTYYNNLFDEGNTIYFQPGCAVSRDYNGRYQFINPQMSYGLTKNPSPNYFNDYQSYIYIEDNGFIYPYIYNSDTMQFDYALDINWYHRFKYFGSDNLSGSYYNYRDSLTDGRFCLAQKGEFLGLIGYSLKVFDSANSALEYCLYNNGVFSATDLSEVPALSLNKLNGTDWLKYNTEIFEKLKDSLIEQGYLSENDRQAFIDDYTKEVLSSLEFIEGEQVEQTTYLKAIYELLKEWLEKIFNKIPEEDEDNDFEDTSNNQSDKLDDLIQDSQVEKPDIDNTNQLVDENLDIGNVEEYGTLLSVFTGNQRILSFILISLTVALIAYVFYGKR